MSGRDKKYGKLSWDTLFDLSKLDNEKLNVNGKTDYQTIVDGLKVLENTPEGQALFSQVYDRAVLDKKFNGQTVEGHKIGLYSSDHNHHQMGQLGVNIKEIQNIVNLSVEGVKRDTLEQVIAHEIRHAVFEREKDPSIDIHKFEFGEYRANLSKKVDDVIANDPEIKRNLDITQDAYKNLDQFIKEIAAKKGISEDEYQPSMLNAEEQKQLAAISQPFYKAMNRINDINPEFFDDYTRRDILSVKKNSVTEEYSMDMENLLANRFKLDNSRKGHYNNSTEEKHDDVISLSQRDIKEKINSSFEIMDERKTYIANIDKAWNNLFDPTRNNDVIASINQIDKFAEDKVISKEELKEINKILESLKKDHGVESEVNAKHNYIQIAYDYKNVDIKITR